MQFLMGLNDSSSAIHGQILLMNPLPSVRQAYSSVSQEEKQRLLSTTSAASDSGNSAAMAVRNNNSGNKSTLIQSERFDRPYGRRPQCSHYGEMGHWVQTCYELHGYPAGHPKAKHNSDPKRFNNSNKPAVNHVSETLSKVDGNQVVGISEAQLQQLLSLLDNKNEGSSSQANAVTKPGEKPSLTRLCRNMADSTRQARIEVAITKIIAMHESQSLLIEKQNTSIKTLTNLMKELTMGLQTLDAKVEQQIRQAAPQMKSMRLDVPRFSGAHPAAWVLHIQRYFDYYNTPNPQRLIIASFHLDGDALDWFDWMSKNHLIIGWHEFLLAIEKRIDDDRSQELENNTANVQLSQEIVEPVNEIPKISLHVMAGQPCPRTLRLQA
ncbi:hypothetical protein JRO89_XS02G0204600 [Xanthoceras sorbifolium]|uniref:Retrotransposon gag domain-containing protein n=1 Tax=Xanthoceras sorbifolium TaxID=99658 RepID=A0ABQ8IGE3_9ROSI|nr:hypothetical protein JRO89_XS02G0204600 [Xanthoceras sorbifolium]